MTNYILSELINEEHRRAELQRLDMGMEGCGCGDCQALYHTIDLEKYGARVRRSGDIIIVTSGAAARIPEAPVPDAFVKAFQDVPVVQKPAVTPSTIKQRSAVAVTADSFVKTLDEAIAEILADAAIPESEKSSRSIAAALKLKGFQISHMTIARRIRAKREKSSCQKVKLTSSSR